MTKAVTTTAALQLLEQGQIALDQPVEEILPEFAELQVLEADGSLRPPASKATIRQLMTHTAGFEVAVYVQVGAAVAPVG